MSHNRRSQSCWWRRPPRGIEGHVCPQKHSAQTGLGGSYAVGRETQWMWASWQFLSPFMTSRRMKLEDEIRCLVLPFIVTWVRCWVDGSLISMGIGQIIQSAYYPTRYPLIIPPHDSHWGSDPHSPPDLRQWCSMTFRHQRNALWRLRPACHFPLLYRPAGQKTWRQSPISSLGLESHFVSHLMSLGTKVL